MNEFTNIKRNEYFRLKNIKINKYSKWMNNLRWTNMKMNEYSKKDEYESKWIFSDE